jgi:hypothetical protein
MVDKFQPFLKKKDNSIRLELINEHAKVKREQKEMFEPNKH